MPEASKPSEVLGAPLADVATVLVGMHRSLQDIQADVEGRLARKSESIEGRIGAFDASMRAVLAEARQSQSDAKKALEATQSAEHSISRLGDIEKRIDHAVKDRAAEFTRAADEVVQGIDARVGKALEGAQLKAEQVVSAASADLNAALAEIRGNLKKHYRILEERTDAAHALLGRVREEHNVGRASIERKSQEVGDLVKECRVELATATARLDEERQTVVRMLVDLDRKTAAFQAKMLKVRRIAAYGSIGVGASVALGLLGSVLLR